MVEGPLKQCRNIKTRSSAKWRTPKGLTFATGQRSLRHIVWCDGFHVTVRNGCGPNKFPHNIRSTLKVFCRVATWVLANIYIEENQHHHLKANLYSIYFSSCCVTTLNYIYTATQWLPTRFIENCCCLTELYCHQFWMKIVIVIVISFTDKFTKCIIYL